MGKLSRKEFASFRVLLVGSIVVVLHGGIWPIGVPDFSTKDATQSADGHPPHVHHAPVQVAPGKCRGKEVVVVTVIIGVVVAMDVLNFGLVKYACQHLLQRTGGFQITQKDDGRGLVFCHDALHMAKVTMYITKKQNHALPL